MRKNKNLSVAAGVIIIFAALGAFWFYSQKQPGEYDSFAKCLGDKGAVFYGAFWCPHCQNQKAIFGKSAKFLPYVECSTADGRSQLQLCHDKNIRAYPTWEFADGSRLSGEISIRTLSEKTGCEIQ